MMTCSELENTIIENAPEGVPPEFITEVFGLLRAPSPNCVDRFRELLELFESDPKKIDRDSASRIWTDKLTLAVKNTAFNEGFLGPVIGGKFLEDWTYWASHKSARTGNDSDLPIVKLRERWTESLRLLLAFRQLDDVRLEALNVELEGVRGVISRAEQDIENPPDDLARQGARQVSKSQNLHYKNLEALQFYRFDLRLSDQDFIGRIEINPENLIILTVTRQGAALSGTEVPDPLIEVVFKPFYKPPESPQNKKLESFLFVNPTRINFSESGRGLLADTVHHPITVLDRFTTAWDLEALYGFLSDLLGEAHCRSIITKAGGIFIGSEELIALGKLDPKAQIPEIPARYSKAFLQAEHPIRGGPIAEHVILGFDIEMNQWYCMEKSIVPESRSQTYGTQVKLLQDHSGAWIEVEGVQILPPKDWKPIKRLLENAVALHEKDRKPAECAPFMGVYGRTAALSCSNSNCRVALGVRVYPQVDFNIGVQDIDVRFYIGLLAAWE